MERLPLQRRRLDRAEHVAHRPLVEAVLRGHRTARLARRSRYNSSRSTTSTAPNCIQMLDDVFLTKDQWEWVEFLCEPRPALRPGAGLRPDPGGPAGRSRTSTSSSTTTPPESAGRSSARRCQLEASPGQIRSGAPEYGQHTEEVLLENGFTWDEVAPRVGRGDRPAIEFRLSIRHFTEPHRKKRFTHEHPRVPFH